MKLIVITKEDFFPEEANRINTMMDKYEFVLHIRKPFASLYETDNLLHRIDKAFRERIVLHDHYSLARKYRLMGIHLNARNTSHGSGQGYREHYNISRSCHSIQEVAEIKERYNYVTLSPIFNSISKQGYGAAFTEEDLRSAAKQGIIDEKVIALGGIDSSNIGDVARLGFGGAAVLGTIWNRTGADDAMEELRKLIEAAGKPTVGPHCSTTRMKQRGDKTLF